MRRVWDRDPENGQRIGGNGLSLGDLAQIGADVVTVEVPNLGAAAPRSRPHADRSQER